MINLTNIPGEQDVTDSRIVINDNFDLIEQDINDISSIIDLNNGRIDNSSYGGGLDDIKTTKVQITTGNVNLSQGDVILNLGSVHLQGSTAQLKFRNSSYLEHTIVGATSTDFNVLNLYGNNHGMVLPKATPSELAAMKSSSDLKVGTFAFRLGGTGGTGPVFYDGNDWKDIDFS